jgi:hypothetical protein
VNLSKNQAAVNDFVDGGDLGERGGGVGMGRGCDGFPHLENLGGINMWILGTGTVFFRGFRDGEKI